MLTGSCAFPFLLFLCLSLQTSSHHSSLPCPCPCPPCPPSLPSLQRDQPHRFCLPFHPCLPCLPFHLSQQSIGIKCAESLKILTSVDEVADPIGSSIASTGTGNSSDHRAGDTSNSLACFGSSALYCRIQDSWTCRRLVEESSKSSPSC